jgi:hypothetical protein
MTRNYLSKKLSRLIILTSQLQKKETNASNQMANSK